jgi:hypothetical protein
MIVEGENSCGYMISEKIPILEIQKSGQNEKNISGCYRPFDLPELRERTNSSILQLHYQF